MNGVYSRRCNRMQFVQRLSVILIVSFAVQDYCADAKRLPSYVKTCRRKEPDLAKCLVEETMESVRPYLPVGIPKMKIPALEPLVIPNLEINRRQEALDLKLIVKDIKAWGGTNFVVKNVKVSYEKLQAEGTIILPLIHTTCEYDIDGRMLVIPLKGKGVFKGNITNIRADVSGSGELTTDKKGRQIAQIKTVVVKLKIGDATGTATNTDGNRNNDVITETAINFYTNNRRQVLDIATPIAEEIAAEFIIQFGNQILGAVLLDEILPDN
ncbi:circadian clock-controlled protein daywake-like isoform X2 [Planococcus citri]|uniref:circadian clock-controlled protein daywake-like isoform X2 n=1 Tax=Planococcus citri TaxID=170843 RepID=UPI0031F7D6CC